MNSNIKPASFTRDLRLTKAEHFSRVFAGSCRFSNRYITVLARRNDLEHPRLGFAISKKCAKRAVDRNRIKRQLREVFRQSTETLPPVDMVVMCRPPILKLDNTTVRQQIEIQWAHIRKKWDDPT
ncbi:MAG: ribonuclease P protein component [Thiotrichaceae bacterium]|nr:ribonuclease P protein component [Thiotrichaceae bacterium]